MMNAYTIIVFIGGALIFLALVSAWSRALFDRRSSKQDIMLGTYIFKYPKSLITLVVGIILLVVALCIKPKEEKYSTFPHQIEEKPADTLSALKKEQ